MHANHFKGMEGFVTTKKKQETNMFFLGTKTDKTQLLKLRLKDLF